MELKEAILKRRSVRKFQDKPVPYEYIEEIISAGLWAPSGCDKQLWRFIVIDNSQLKQRIVDEGGAVFIKDAPVGILVLYDNRTDNTEYRDYIQSASAAIHNMLLAATSLGIGSCWVCHLPLKCTLRKILRVPGYFDPIAYVALGYPAHEPKLRPRKDTVKYFISRNIFNFKKEESSFISLEAKRLLRRVYFSLPLALKKALRPIAEKQVKKFD